MGPEFPSGARLTRGDSHLGGSGTAARAPQSTERKQYVEAFFPNLDRNHVNRPLAQAEAAREGASWLNLEEAVPNGHVGPSPRGRPAVETGNVAGHHGPPRLHHHPLMAGRFAIGMVLLDRGVAADEACRQLASALPGADCAVPDDVGVFEVMLDADSQENALARVWDAVAASGCDDHVAFLEHPTLPDHWRHLAKAPA